MLFCQRLPVAMVRLVRLVQLQRLSTLPGGRVQISVPLLAAAAVGPGARPMGMVLAGLAASAVSPERVQQRQPEVRPQPGLVLAVMLAILLEPVDLVASAAAAAGRVLRLDTAMAR